MMATATFNGQVIAESDETVIVEGNHYFPPAAVNQDFLTASETSSVCPWKGTAGYYDVVVGDGVSEAAAWYYAEPKPEAAEIKDHVAFWKDVEVAA
jgi:uncharacterized protein (DUF427 family)